MGDRGNVQLSYDDGSEIYIYAHWHGSVLAQRVRSALAKKWRWDDPQYLARIIYDEVVGDEFGEETGFGLSTEIGDGDVRITVLMDQQKVHLGGVTMTFADFVGSGANSA